MKLFCFVVSILVIVTFDVQAQSEIKSGYYPSFDGTKIYYAPYPLREYLQGEVFCKSGDVTDNSWPTVVRAGALLDLIACEHREAITK